MASTLLSLLVVSAVTFPLDESEAVELRYSGTLTPQGRNFSNTPVKDFNVYCLVMHSNADGHEVVFLVDEQGSGGWAWPERFGSIQLDSTNKPTNHTQVRVLHTHDGTQYPLSVQQPLFEFTNNLQAAAEWKAGKHTYRVLQSRKRRDRDCWEIEVTSNLGRMQMFLVEKETGVVVSAEQRIFMGRGDEFSLKVVLDSVQTIDDERLAQLRVPIKTLQQLQQDLKRKENATQPELTKQQVETAAAIVDRLERESESTPFSRLAAVINRDIRAQARRLQDVKNISARYVGQSAPDFQLQSLDGNSIAPDQWKGQIVLLHFWDYQGEPLEEPYGQIGYLDYLHNRRRKMGVKIYGVAVDERLTKQTQSRSALRSIRKLRNFMNLSYPVTRDDGTLLRKFGDPRSVGAKLPLWVVIDSEGEIAHYHVGFYQIHPNEGLRQLDEILVELIKKERMKN